MTSPSSGVPNSAHDELLVQLAEYVTTPLTASDEAYVTARMCLADSLGCALLALNYPECTRLLGPVVPEAACPGGARVPGTHYELEPVQAAFNIGAMIRWLDYNDTWLAAEWGHPSDNLGGILALGDYLSRKRAAAGQPRLVVRDVLEAMIQAHEIQGVLALENSFNRVGLDHVLLVRVATTAVATRMLGGTREQVIAALSQAWLDGGALRTYRHAPNTGPRKSWAAGDATRRGVQLALWTLRGEAGYASPLSAPQWGFSDVLFGGHPLVLARPLGSYVMEHVLFKVNYPVEFHAQTAVEAAAKLHEEVAGRLEQIERVEIETQEAAVRIIDKTGPLVNRSDRDHCLQYAVAVALLTGKLEAEDYNDAAAADPRIDRLREKMVVRERVEYSRNYLDPERRSIANAVQVFYKGGQPGNRVEVKYPLGHRRRRSEAEPMLIEKFRKNAGSQLSSSRAEDLLALFADAKRLDALSVDEFLGWFLPE